MPAVPVSNEVAGQIYRLAQAQRLTRYCIERGVDPRLVSAGRLQIGPESDPRRGRDNPARTAGRSVRSSSAAEIVRDDHRQRCRHEKRCPPALANVTSSGPRWGSSSGSTSERVSVQRVKLFESDAFGSAQGSVDCGSQAAVAV